MKLTDEQKQFLRENFKETPNLLDLTRNLFSDDTLDGRTKEGRAVRAFLAEESLKYETTKWDKVEDIELSSEQIEFVPTCYLRATTSSDSLRSMLASWSSLGSMSQPISTTAKAL
jgi:hypothetical protein